MTSLAVRLERSSANSTKRTFNIRSAAPSCAMAHVSILTVPGSGETQVPHAVADQLGQLLPLGAPVEVQALLSDALGVVFGGVPAGPLPPGAFFTQTSCPLHALLPQQRGIRLLVAAGLLPPVFGVLTVVNIDRHLRLQYYTKV